MGPEECLRSLTGEALLRAMPGHALLPDSLAVMATANAFVMLGLVPEHRAEEILEGHRTALQAKDLGGAWGVNDGELTVRPGAHEYWTARGDSVAELPDIPLRVLPAGIRLPVTVSGRRGEVCFEWLTLTRAGWRMSFRASTGGAPRTSPGPPGAPADQVMSQISVTDDAGHEYELNSGIGGWGGRTGPDRYEWHAEAVAEPNPAGQAAEWLEFVSSAGGAPQRVPIVPKPYTVTGTAEPRWPTPAEAFIEPLARIDGFDLNGTVLTPNETASIVATVAECLMAVGALPSSSTLLREARAGGQEWQALLASRWGRRAHQQAAEFRSPERGGLVAELPFKHATAIIESVSAHGELVIIRLYGHPWVMGEYWPMITPCFAVHATDDRGHSYEGMPGNWRGGANHQGSGQFWFWPPVPESCERLRVTVSTLWEAAWADIDLPGRAE
jgi:hypothetical protein